MRVEILQKTRAVSRVDQIDCRREDALREESGLVGGPPAAECRRPGDHDSRCETSGPPNDLGWGGQERKVSAQAADLEQQQHD